jgi:hypothetical protein
MPHVFRSSRQARWALLALTLAAAGGVLAASAVGGAATSTAGALAALSPAPAGPWDAFNYSPASRTVRPVAVYATTGTVTKPSAVLSGGATSITGTGSSLTLDFGKEVGGFVSLHFASTTSPSQSVGLTYSEWSTYVSSTKSDGSNGGSNNEPPVQYAATPGSGVDTQTDVPTAGGGTNTSTTLAASVAAGATRFQVASTALLTVGKKINVDTGANLESGKVTAVLAGASTTLSTPALAGDSNVKVASSAGLAAGQTITIDTGALLETVVISTVGTAGATGSGITFAPALTLPHAVGASVVQPPAISLAPALGRAHARGASVFQTNSELRGGFRYLTVVNMTSGALDLDGASVRITFAPEMTDLRAYPNYFYSNDPLLNRIWYAGAYTVQSNIIANDQGRVWGAPSLGWNNSAIIGEAGNTVHVDGAKRDRTVWPGDLGISVPSDFASIGDLVTVRNSLQTLYNHQDAGGQLPYAGPAVNFYGSDAYHMWTLIGTATYYQYSGDRTWLDGIWSKYKLGLTYITNKIGADNLLNVTSSNDWARSNSGGKNIEANAIMYRTLITCRALATVEGDNALASSCATKAAALKTAINAGGYWDPTQNLYRNVPSGTSSTLYPQDGNSLAVWFGLVDSATKATAISRALSTRWTSVGALTPEKSASSVHPFPGSMEVQAHFLANEDVSGLDLIRLEWGYMLDAPYGTASTFWEGYKTDGTSDYGGSYISAAHGWATGPTSALTFYVLGIDPDPSGGSTYSIVPHPGDLTYVEGQLTTPSGVVTESWDRDTSTGTFRQHFSAPDGTVRTVGAPTFGQTTNVWVDGHLVWDGARAFAYDAHTDGAYVYLDGIPSGSHDVVSGPPRETTMVFTAGSASSGDFNDLASFSALLSDEFGPVVGGGVTFSLANTAQSCTASSDASGVATCSIVPSEPAGQGTVTASFAGSSVDLPSSVSASFVVSREEATLSYTGASGSLVNGSQARLSAVLKEDGQSAIAGRLVSFRLGGGASAQTCTARTDAAGLASCAVTVNQPPGPDVVTAGFAGDGYYLPASDSASATVLFAFAGFFAPVVNPPTLNVVKAGSGVPVRFGLGGNYGLAIFAAGYPQVQAVACEPKAATHTIAAKDTLRLSSSALSYDQKTGRYTYAWATAKNWANSCRRLDLKLSDGSIHSALFKLTK